MRQALSTIVLAILFSVSTVSGELTPAGNLYHPNLSKMAKPSFWEGLPLVNNTVSSSSKEAVAHVKQGISCLMAMWDFEAYRHFAEALLIDPDCLLANWGVAMSLAGSSGEYGNERLFAANRALTLADAKNDEGAYIYPKIERGYVGVLAVLLDQGPRQAAKAYKGLHHEYPNDLFSAAMSCVLLRQGYDELGLARPDQEEAEKNVEAFLKKDPDNPLYLMTYLGVHSVMPSGDARMREKILPAARKLHEKSPEFPMSAMMRGHISWRVGEFSEAEKAFILAEKQFLTYMNEHKVSVYDCASRVRAALYASVAMNSQGKVQQAMDKAQTLAVFDIDQKRIFSSGAVELLWEAKTMQARLAMSNQSSEDFKKAIQTLPEPDENKVFKGKSLFVYYAQSLALYLQGRVAVYENDLQKARAIHTLLERNINAYSKTKNDARRTSSYTHWIRGLRASKMMAAELLGFVTLAGPKESQDSAMNWFRSASSWQRSPSLMIYPSIFYPQQRHIGGFLTARSINDRALDVLNEGLAVFPNHLPSLKEKVVVLQKLGKASEAKKVMSVIEAAEKK